MRRLPGSRLARRGIPALAALVMASGLACATAMAGTTRTYGPAEVQGRVLTFDLGSVRRDSIVASSLVSHGHAYRLDAGRLRSALLGGRVRVRLLSSHASVLRGRTVATTRHVALTARLARQASVQLKVVTDTTPPETTITAGPSGAVSATSVSFSFSSSERRSRFECRTDGAAWQACSSPASDTGLAVADHLFEVRAIDRAGNADPTPASRAWSTVAAPAPAPAPAPTPAPAPAPQPSPAPSGAQAITRPVGSPPLSDAEAAAHVRRSPWEPRPDNDAANQRFPTAAELDLYYNTRRAAHLYADNPYAYLVTGNFSGTTDEIIQWAAWKWGIDEDVIRAAAVAETHWHQSTIGDAGESFGLMQIKRSGSHTGTWPLSQQSTAFNVDYYGAHLRYVYDGLEIWLNDVDRGQTYLPGDLWGTVGSWYSGRWYYNNATYIATVQNYAAQKVWAAPGF
jgi:hypothetical protein